MKGLSTSTAHFALDPRALGLLLCALRLRLIVGNRDVATTVPMFPDGPAERVGRSYDGSAA